MVYKYLFELAEGITLDYYHDILPIQMLLHEKVRIVLTEEEMEKIQNVSNLVGKIVGTCRLVDEIPTTF
jgi:hypothetical protein